MINYSRHTLSNGLRIVIHEDYSTPIVAINMLYNVGSRDDDPERTGFAHLFEHLMFGGSENAPSYDDPIQFAGGESNAFTNTDVTNFFCVLPAENFELGLFLEADRMQHLKLDKHLLEVEQQVVCEEFKETCLSEPYGDVWHLMSALSYREHPYRWPVIGMSMDHIDGAKIDDVQEFYQSFYGPNNAICVVAGPIKTEVALEQIRKHFGQIESRVRPEQIFHRDQLQTAIRTAEHQSEVPVDAVFMAFHMGGRMDEGYYEADLLADILASGYASRMHNVLVKELQCASSIDAYITGTSDPGLFVIEAKCADGFIPAGVEAAIWPLLEELGKIPVADRELKRHIHKSESSIAFSNMSVLNKAMNLAYFELIGDTELINSEQEMYEKITADMLRETAASLFRRENCSVLYYRKKENL
jgi:predicted Zn-dependent peptidase